MMQRAATRWPVGAAIGVTAALLALAGQAAAEPLGVQVTDATGRALEGAVVSVMVRGTRERAAPGTTAEMTQRDRAFQPGVLAVQTGTAVSFPNLDTVRHHVYSFSPIKPFEIKLYVGTPAAPVIFDKPGTAVLGCNIHDRMVGFIHVVDSPHFGRTDATGTLTLDVPAGEHQVRVWHPSLQATGAPLQSGVRVAAGSGGALTLRLP
jgi:plastocyanin